MKEKQRTLFDDAPVEAPWEDQEESPVAVVVFGQGARGAFHYRVPEEMADAVCPGKRLEVPFGRGNRPRIGYCVDLLWQRVSGDRLKSVRRVLDERALLSPTMLKLTAWIADHYLCEWGQVLEAVVPAGVRRQAGSRWRIFVRATVAAANLENLKLTAKQRKVLEILTREDRAWDPRDLAAASGCKEGVLKNLVLRGWIRKESVRVREGKLGREVFARQAPLALTDEQRTARDAVLEVLRSGKHGTVLIQGVTGSGKTEVYIQAIQEVVSYGRQAVVLVPEISLTPQTLDRFRSRFEHVAVLHSHLTDVERARQWEWIASGGVQVVVGARSAVFAPTPHLGLIVLDEEHETSFKQDETPRYHARDVALQRAMLENVPLVLGSATPSLESWHGAQSGRYRLVKLSRRIEDRPLPAVRTIDLREPRGKRGDKGAITRRLDAAVRQALAQGGQVILLLNRRGFATHIQCARCGYVVRCPDCDIALTHHRSEATAMCHYCDYRVPAPTRCPECRFEGIHFSGLGTERLEAEIRARYPDVACLRMDADTMRSRGSHEKALEAFRRGEVRILLGTQMIAKGLDFPNVTLVGVINADTALHFPDFRAAERTFQLVTQVAGRTGRGDQGGEVWVQTFDPENPAILAAVRHDYEQFAAWELPNRRSMHYPPFAQLIRFVLHSVRQAPARLAAETLAERIRQEWANAANGEALFRLLGPAPAPLAKLRGRFRYHFLIQTSDGERLRRAIRSVLNDVRLPEEIACTVDVDPIDML
ncbi:MAG: primosomal protein N' [Thermogutta sp.]|nr:primosomal protein N' [Thermogutta sp.]